MTREAFDRAIAEALALVDQAVAGIFEREENSEEEIGNLKKRTLVALHMVNMTPRLHAAADELYDAACAYADARRQGIRSDEHRVSLASKRLALHEARNRFRFRVTLAKPSDKARESGLG